MKQININRMVYVKLTDYGNQIAKEDPTWKLNKVVDGWTEVQLWVLMYTFGPYLCNGGQVPFETMIRFKDEDFEETE